MHQNSISKILLIFTLCCQIGLFGQQVSNLQNGVKGFWTTNSEEIYKINWQAQWIWMPDKIENDIMLARRSFNLTEIPKSSILRISASSKYELYLNGKYICQGPARSAPHHQSFDVLDISSLISKGRNIIAVRVHYQRGTTSYHLQGRAGLLAQLDLKGDNFSSTIITNNNWRVQPDLSWNNNSKPMNRFQQVVNDQVNLSLKIYNFEKIDFDDSNWLEAKPLLRNSGWPAPKKNEKATTLTTPWISLVQRDIPYLNERDLQATKLIEARQLQSSTSENNSVELKGLIEKNIYKQFKKHLKNGESITLNSSDNKSWFLLFDFGKIINGMPKFTIEGEKNTIVNILSAPYIINNEFTHKIVASEYNDEVILSSKKDSWQSMYFKPTRYLAVLVKGNIEKFKIHNVGIHQLEYPFKEKGEISIPEAPWIEDLWNASIKTLEACTTDAFTDNYRERRQYAQTGYYAALGNYFTLGDLALQRRYLIQIAQEQQANGLMPAYAPLTKDDYMVILDSNCLYIRSLHNYLLYSGDYKTVSKLLPNAEKLMSLLDSFTNDLGMLESPPYSYWLDHTLNDRQGANLTLNGHYLGALEDFSQVLKWMKKNNESEIFNAKAKLLRESLKKHFWDSKRELFADAYINGKLSNKFSEHANAMVLANNITSTEQAELISNELLKNDNHNFIIRENGLVMVSPAMSYFLHKGLAENGYIDESLNMLHQRFKRMLNPETNGTLWEEWWRNGTGRTGKFQERTRSDAQTESVFPPALFVKYLLGITVTKPGIKEIEITKPNTSLTQIEAEIPIKSEFLFIEWNLDSENKLFLRIPSGTKVKLDLQSLKSTKNIIINNKLLNEGQYQKDFIELENGSFEIIF